MGKTSKELLEKVIIYANLSHTKWAITYFNEKVFKAIQALPKKLKARYVVLADAMIERGPNLGMPHTKALSNGLFEIRVKVKEGIARIFYCVQISKEIIILHSFIKKNRPHP